jgi:hypothetical protein
MAGQGNWGQSIGQLHCMFQVWARHHITSHHITSHHITSHHIMPPPSRRKTIAAEATVAAKTTAGNRWWLMMDMAYRMHALHPSCVAQLAGCPAIYHHSVILCLLWPQWRHCCPAYLSPKIRRRVHPRNWGCLESWQHTSLNKASWSATGTEVGTLREGWRALQLPEKVILSMADFVLVVKI